MNPLLLARARKLLAEASVIAEAPGVSFIPKGDRQYGTSDPTTGVGGDTFSTFARRLAGCRSDNDLQSFISALESELEAIRKRPMAPKPKLKAEVLYGCWVGQHYAAVERASGASAREIRRWREAAGFEPNYGRKAA